MSSYRSIRGVVVSAMLGALWLPLELHAADYPARTITMIVPFAAGGAADITGRILAEGMSRQLGYRIIVENATGAGGTIGSTRGKNAANDGYTISLGHMGTHAAAFSLYPHIGYDPRKDFEYIGLIARSPIILFARKSLPAKTLPEFIKYAREKGPELKDGHSGVGSISHIACALLAQIIGTAPTTVPYRGVGPMINDMLGDTVDYGCDLVLAVSSHLNSGSIIGIAVAAAERSPAIPDVPTTVEGGLPDFQADAWTALFAPKGTPEPIMKALRNAASKALDDPAVSSRLVQLGATVPKPDERSPEYLKALVTKEVDRWAKVIEAAGISAE
jgi:tripartite-type tricarboxylate transporter receptor subunit TctC